MFTLAHDTNAGSIAVNNSRLGFSASLFLKEGGSLQKLILKNKHIIKLLDPEERKQLFTSSILFPFAGRVKNNQYNFQGNSYNLMTNQKGESMALHGFVYNKTFEVVASTLEEQYAAVSLKYIESEETAGFPYKYSITLNYKFTQSSVDLDVLVANEDAKPFPFSIGWHPYFRSSNLQESVIKLESNEQIVFGKDMTPNGTEYIQTSEINLANKKLDNGYLLNNKVAQFITPDYKLNISSNASSEQYLQLYTPENDSNIIAIEPLTAPANSFNNQMGLQVLEPNRTYKLTFGVSMDETMRTNTPSTN